MQTNDCRARFFELKSKMTSLIGEAKSANRALTEEENSQMEQYRSELLGVQAEMQIEAAERMAAALPVENEERNLALRFAEAMVGAFSGTPLAVPARRDYAGNDKASVAGATPLTLGEIIQPLEKGNILGLLGCHIQTGLSGDWKYPVVANIEAEIAGESAEISDSKLTITAVTPTPHRVALSILVTKTAINATNDELKNIVLTQLVAGLDRLLNKWMFKRTAIATGVNGLFVNPGTQKVITVEGAPTYAEILGLKAEVDAKGVKPDGTAAYVMTNAMRATLEATEKGAHGIGFVIENNMINGVPVYVTEYAPEGCVEFGYFSYALVGQFGVSDIIVDPFTKATSNSVRFILNADFDIKAARPEAFGILGPEGQGSGSAA